MQYRQCDSIEYNAMQCNVRQSGGDTEVFVTLTRAFSLSLSLSPFLLLSVTFSLLFILFLTPLSDYRYLSLPLSLPLSVSLYTSLSLSPYLGSLHFLPPSSKTFAQVRSNFFRRTWARRQARLLLWDVHTVAAKTQVPAATEAGDGTDDERQMRFRLPWQPLIGVWLRKHR